MSDFDPTSHPHRRYNPLAKEFTLVSSNRAKRPWQGQVEPPSVSNLPKYDPKCYLCPGNSRAGGQQNEKYEQTMTFENDFPAVLPPPGPKQPKSQHPLLQSDPVQGACDVIVFHPRHNLTLARLPPSDIERIIREWINLYVRRGRQQGIKYVQIFENKGAMMGCSNPHPHGQAWSLSKVPSLPSTELASLKEYSSRKEHRFPASGVPRGPQGRQCLLCDYVHFELTVPRNEGRIVLSNDHWTALVPYWGVWPFEIMLLPHNRHISDLTGLTEGEILSFAQIISGLTIRYDNLFSTSFAYSMGIHQKPTPDGPENYAHLHLHFNPPLLRSATVRKFLVGFEMMGEPQRDLTPEQAAAQLRDLPSVHYLDTKAKL